MYSIYYLQYLFRFETFAKNLINVNKILSSNKFKADKNDGIIKK
jgi:hypothetical protein